MLARLRRLYQYRELLYMLAVRDFKLRYKQTVMGVLWALLMPVAIVLAGVVIRLVAAKAGVRGFEIMSVIVKSLPWAFFISSIRFATGSLSGNSNLVAKVAFPKEVFPLAAIAACLTDFFVALVAGTIVLLLMKHNFPPTTWLAPLLLLPLFALIVGMGLLLASLNLFFRDVRYVVEVVLMFAIFFTPVLYDVEMLGPYANVAMLNPLAPILEALRDTIVMGQLPHAGWTLYSCAFSLVALVVGYRTFKNLEYMFAERI